MKLCMLNLDMNVIRNMNKYGFWLKVGMVSFILC